MFPALRTQLAVRQQLQNALPAEARIELDLSRCLLAARTVRRQALWACLLSDHRHCAEKYRVMSCESRAAGYQLPLILFRCFRVSRKGCESLFQKGLLPSYPLFRNKPITARLDPNRSKVAGSGTGLGGNASLICTLLMVREDS